MAPRKIVSGTSEQQTRIYTVGHSNRSLDMFVEMIRSAGVDFIIDIRSFPRSRTNPQFNIDVLLDTLAVHQIGYQHCDSLGGRRTAQKGVAPETNQLWRNQSFHNYADYALTKQFRNAIEALLELAMSRRPALMCSEAVWWRCHRRIVADHLLVRGIEVVHIMDIGKTTLATITPGATVQPNGSLIYP